MTPTESSVTRQLVGAIVSLVADIAMVIFVAAYAWLAWTKTPQIIEYFGLVQLRLEPVAAGDVWGYARQLPVRLLACYVAYAAALGAYSVGFAAVQWALCPKLEGGDPS